MADKSVIDTIIAEAGGDGRKGMEAVAWAIANRAAKSGKTLEQVVKQPHQFEGYSNPGSGSRRAQQDPAIRARVESILNGIENGTIADPLQGGTMFHSSKSNPYWSDAENKHGTVKIGGQTYYLGGAALPPMNVPQVASLTDTVGPKTAPVPFTASPDLALMRNPAVSVAAQRAQVTPPLPVARPQNVPTPQNSPPPTPMSASDSLAFNPVQGVAVPDLNAGRYTGPAFDTNYARTDRPDFASVGATPYEMPRTPPQVDPGLQAALARQQLRTTLPALPPPSTIGQLPATRSVASVPMPALSSPDRLPKSPRGLPEQYGSGIPSTQVASIGLPLGGEVDPLGRRVTMPAQTAPFPMPPLNRTAVASQIDTQPMPAMPIPRPIHFPTQPAPMPVRQPTVQLTVHAQPQQRMSLLSQILGQGRAPGPVAPPQQQQQRPSTQSILDITDIINGRSTSNNQQRSGSTSW